MPVVTVPLVAVCRAKFPERREPGSRVARIGGRVARHDPAADDRLEETTRDQALAMDARERRGPEDAPAGPLQLVQDLERGRELLVRQRHCRHTSIQGTSNVPSVSRTIV